MGGEKSAAPRSKVNLVHLPMLTTFDAAALADRSALYRCTLTAAARLSSSLQISYLLNIATVSCPLMLIAPLLRDDGNCGDSYRRDRSVLEVDLGRRSNQRHVGSV